MNKNQFWSGSVTVVNKQQIGRNRLSGLHGILQMDHRLIRHQIDWPGKAKSTNGGAVLTRLKSLKFNYLGPLPPGT